MHLTNLSGLVMQRYVVGGALAISSPLGNSGKWCASKIEAKSTFDALSTCATVLGRSRSWSPEITLLLHYLFLLTFRTKERAQLEHKYICTVSVYVSFKQILFLRYFVNVISHRPNAMFPYMISIFLADNIYTTPLARHLAPWI